MAKRQTGSGELRRTCGTMAAHMMLLERFPAFRMNQMRLEAGTARRRQTTEDLRQAPIVTIETVVHVLYNTPEQNVTTKQINSQISVLNKDFRATNPDRSATPDPFKGLVSDARIRFKLVNVTRTRTATEAFSHDDGMSAGRAGGSPRSSRRRT